MSAPNQKPRPLRLSALLAAAASLALAARPAPPASPSKAAAPRLIVLLAVDGLNYDRLQQYRPYYVSGLKRLLDEGYDFAATHYRHINTETGPGHSSLGTGAPPRVTGIVANRWYEQNPDGSIRSVNCASQWSPTHVPGVPPLFYEEVAKDGRLYVFSRRAELQRWRSSGEVGRSLTRLAAGPQGETVVFDHEDAVTLFNLRHGRPEEAFPPSETVAGPGNLRVPTLGDRLVAERAGARVVSLAAKDRSALLMAGRDPRHVVYWYDKDTGRFVTSPVYDTATDPGALGKALVARFNAEQAGARLPGRFGLLWKKLPAPDAAPGPRLLPTPVPDLQDYQLPAQGVGFDHDLSRDPAGYFNGLYVSPFVDQLLADLVLEFLEDPKLGLGRGAQPDLLAVSFAAQDVVSHSHGAESEENLDTLRRLDLQLGRLFAALDRLLPPGSVALGLSADHGFTPIPEVHRLEHPDEPGGRLVTGDRSSPNFLGRLNRLLSEELCLAPGSRPLYGLDGWSVMYNRPVLPARSVAGPCGPADRRVTSGDVDAALPKVVARYFAEELSAVYPIAQRASWKDDDPLVEFLRNDLDLERSGDAFLIPRPYVLLHWDPARGSGHGTQHEYDTHVPLVFWGGPFRPGRSEEPATPYDMAPTLGALLGIPLPDAVGHSRAPRQ